MQTLSQIEYRLVDGAIVVVPSRLFTYLYRLRSPIGHRSPTVSPNLPWAADGIVRGFLPPI